MLMTASIPSLRALAMLTTIGDVADDLDAVFNRLVAEWAATIRGAQDRAATREDAANVLEGEFAQFFRPNEAVETVGNAHDFPLVFEDCGFHGGPNDRVESGGVSAAGTDADSADFRYK